MPAHRSRILWTAFLTLAALFYTTTGLEEWTGVNVARQIADIFVPPVGEGSCVPTPRYPCGGKSTTAPTTGSTQSAPQSSAAKSAAASSIPCKQYPWREEMSACIKKVKENCGTQFPEKRGTDYNQCVNTGLMGGPTTKAPSLITPTLPSPQAATASSRAAVPAQTVSCANVAEEKKKDCARQLRADCIAKIPKNVKRQNECIAQGMTGTAANAPAAAPSPATGQTTNQGTAPSPTLRNAAPSSPAAPQQTSSRQTTATPPSTPTPRTTNQTGGGGTAPARPSAKAGSWDGTYGAHGTLTCTSDNGQTVTKDFSEAWTVVNNVVPDINGGRTTIDAGGNVGFTVSASGLSFRYSLHFARSGNTVGVSGSISGGGQIANADGTTSAVRCSAGLSGGGTSPQSPDGTPMTSTPQAPAPAAPSAPNVPAQTPAARECGSIPVYNCSKCNGLQSYPTYRKESCLTQCGKDYQAAQDRYNSCMGF